MADPEGKDDKSAKSEEDEFTAEDRAKLQEVVDKERKARRDADAKLKEAQSELDKLKTDADSSKSDMDKLKESISDLQKRAEQAERDALVAKVAQAKKLPAKLADRLAGSNREELEADADDLIEALGLGEDDDTSKPQSVGRPKEKLQAGASNEDDEPEITPEKGEEIAESIRKSETF